jgi:ribose transport system permease protein
MKKNERWPTKALDIFLKYNTEFILLILIVISSLISSAFFTERNIFNLLRQVSGTGIISMGMLLVIDRKSTRLNSSH